MRSCIGAKYELLCVFYYYIYNIFLAGLAKKILQTIVDFLNAAIFSLIIVRVAVYIMSFHRRREVNDVNMMHPLTSHHLTQPRKIQICSKIPRPNPSKLNLQYTTYSIFKVITHHTHHHIEITYINQKEWRFKRRS